MNLKKDLKKLTKFYLLIIADIILRIGASMMMCVFGLILTLGLIFFTLFGKKEMIESIFDDGYGGFCYES